MINRRNLILGTVLGVAGIPRFGTAKVLLQPEDFSGRSFITILQSPSQKTIRFVQSSVFRFSFASDAALGVSHLANLREFEDRGEIYVVDLEPIEDIPDRFGDINWFVSYTTLAGIAAFETQQAHAVFVTDSLLHEIEVSGHDPVVTSDLVMDLGDRILDISVREQPLEGFLVDEEDLPDGLEIYQEVTSEGTFDADGTPVPGNVPPWDQIQY